MYLQSCTQVVPLACPRVLSTRTTLSARAQLRTGKRQNATLKARFFPHPLVGYSYAPLSHTMQRHHDLTTMAAGGRVAFASGVIISLIYQDMTIFLEDIAACRPTVLVGAPRVWNMIYNKYLAREAEELRSGGELEEVKAKLSKEFAGILGGRTTSLTTGTSVC